MPGWLVTPGETIVYTNPYYDIPTTTPVIYDYSQPLPVPAPVLVESDEGAPPVAQPPTEPTDEKSALAATLFEKARDAFMKKDYEKAQVQIDEAIKCLPSDAVMHEFRALVLFARKKYRESSAAVYSLLAVGPGWSWETMRSLYPDAATYTEQLRALEEYCRATPKAASARFLLAYHYLTLDARDAAVKTLKNVVELLPSDQLASHLLKMLSSGEETERPPMPGL